MAVLITNKDKPKDCAHCWHHFECDKYDDYLAGTVEGFIDDECPIKAANTSGAAGVESHSEEEIYKGCLRLIRQVVNYFDEYLDYLDIHQEDLLEEERFSIALSNFEIVQNLFLYSTGHSGGTSTRKKCRELGLDDSDHVEFRFKEDPNADEEE